MSLYRDSCIEILNSRCAKEVYRFEGAKTVSRLDFQPNNDKRYVYLSSSLDHHKYFMMKRLKQMINEIVFDETGETFSAKNIQKIDNYPKIRNLIFYSNELQPLYSYRLVCSTTLDKILKNCSVRQEQKENDKKYIEKVDRRVYGGGYGLTEEWRDLFKFLCFYYAKTSINRKDLLEYVSNVRKNRSINRIDNLSFIVNNIERYKYYINPSTLSNFNKYNIVNSLESIVEKEMVLPNTNLMSSPKKVIHQIVDDYEREKEKVLQVLDKKYELEINEDEEEKSLSKTYGHRIVK